MSLSRRFRLELGEYLKGNHPNFEREWSIVLDRLELKSQPTVKLGRDPYECPRCGLRLR